jgi:hypothetical protein
MPITVSPASPRHSANNARHRVLLLLAALAMAVVLITVTGIALVRRQSPPPPVAAQKTYGVALLFDFSDSMPFVPGSQPDVDARIDPLYSVPVEDLFAQSIGYSRRLFVVVVSNSNSAAWSYDVPAKGETMDSTVGPRRLCKAAQGAFKAFLARSLRGPVSDKTDLVDAFERVSAADPHRTWRVIVASDGLQAAVRPSGKVNLEQNRVTSATVPDLVRLSAPESPLPGLADASIEFVLPARSVDDRHFANGLSSTRLFWDSWLSKYAPSSSVYSFETFPREFPGETGGCK